MPARGKYNPWFGNLITEHTDPGNTNSN